MTQQTHPGKVHNSAESKLNEDANAVRINFDAGIMNVEASDLFSSEIEMMTGQKWKAISTYKHRSDKYNALTLLNACHVLLRVRFSEGRITEAESIAGESMLTFLDEASANPEYCTTVMLKKFSGFILISALDGFSDKTENLFKHSIDDLSSGLVKPMTPDDLKRMHDSECRPNAEEYTCISDSIPFLAIQVIYALLSHTFKQENIIRKCDNCGMYFVPGNRNQIYCRESSPQDSDKSCAEYMKVQKQILCQNKDLQKIYRSICEMLRKRGRDAVDEGNEKDIIYFAEELSTLQDNWKAIQTDEGKAELLKEWRLKYPGKGKRNEHR